MYTFENEGAAADFMEDMAYRLRDLYDPFWVRAAMKQALMAASGKQSISDYMHEQNMKPVQIWDVQVMGADEFTHGRAVGFPWGGDRKILEKRTIPFPGRKRYFFYFISDPDSPEGIQGIILNFKTLDLIRLKEGWTIGLDGDLSTMEIHPFICLDADQEPFSGQITLPTPGFAYVQTYLEEAAFVSRILGAGEADSMDEESMEDLKEMLGPELLKCWKLPEEERLPEKTYNDSLLRQTVRTIWTSPALYREIPDGMKAAFRIDNEVKCPSCHRVYTADPDDFDETDMDLACRCPYCSQSIQYGSRETPLADVCEGDILPSGQAFPAYSDLENIEGTLDEYRKGRSVLAAEISVRFTDEAYFAVPAQFSREQETVWGYVISQSVLEAWVAVPDCDWEEFQNRFYDESCGLDYEVFFGPARLALMEVCAFSWDPQNGFRFTCLCDSRSPYRGRMADAQESAELEAFLMRARPLGSQPAVDYLNEIVKRIKCEN